MGCRPICLRKFNADHRALRSLDAAQRQGGKRWELRAAIDLAGLWRDQGKTAGRSLSYNPSMKASQSVTAPKTGRQRENCLPLKKV